MELEQILAKHGRRPEEIQQIYYGGDHVCRCGCKGRSPAAARLSSSGT